MARPPVRRKLRSWMKRLPLSGPQNTSRGWVARIAIAAIAVMAQTSAISVRRCIVPHYKGAGHAPILVPHAMRLPPALSFSHSDRLGTLLHRRDAHPQPSRHQRGGAAAKAGAERV